METKDKEIRAFNFEIRTDEEKTGRVEGRAIVYDSKTDMGWYDEIIERGALDSTDLKDVRMLVNHNTDMIPLARSRNNNENSTLFLSVDEGGMKIRADLDTENNAEAKSLYSAISRKDVSGMSFMFAVDGDKWDGLDSDHPTRTITKIRKVFEVSAVTWPAYEATSISVRGLAGALDSAKASLESARREQRAVEARKKKLKILAQM